MRRRTAVIGALATCILALAPASSDAHDITLATSLSRFKVPGGTTERGDKVVILGRLKSADPTCYGGITVGLYRVQATGHRLLARDLTDGQGEYAFERRPRRDQTIYVKFDGFMQTVTGHSHTCGGSTSREVNVRVRR